jgi:hypothetical protein
MEAFSLQDPLDLKNPDKINNWRVTIRFYVRGSSMDDVTYLRENLKTRKDELLPISILPYLDVNKTKYL